MTLSALFQELESMLEADSGVLDHTSDRSVRICSFAPDQNRDKSATDSLLLSEYYGPRESSLVTIRGSDRSIPRRDCVVHSGGGTQKIEPAALTWSNLPQIRPICPMELNEEAPHLTFSAVERCCSVQGCRKPLVPVRKFTRVEVRNGTWIRTSEFLPSCPRHGVQKNEDQAERTKPALDDCVAAPFNTTCARVGSATLDNLLPPSPTTPVPKSWAMGDMSALGEEMRSRPKLTSAATRPVTSSPVQDLYLGLAQLRGLPKRVASDPIPSMQLPPRPLPPHLTEPPRQHQDVHTINVAKI